MQNFKIKNLSSLAETIELTCLQAYRNLQDFDEGRRGRNAQQ